MLCWHMWYNSAIPYVLNQTHALTGDSVPSTDGEQRGNAEASSETLAELCTSWPCPPGYLANYASCTLMHSYGCYHRDHTDTHIKILKTSGA